MDADNNQKEDLKVPEGELGEQIKEAWAAGGDEAILLTVIAAVGKEAVNLMKKGTK